MLADDQNHWGEVWNSGRPNKQLYIRKKLVISSGRIFARGEGERYLFAPHKQHLHSTHSEGSDMNRPLASRLIP